MCYNEKCSKSGVPSWVNYMYYYYHQHLQSILAAERWVTAEELRERPYSLLGVATHKEASQLFARVKLALGKEIGSHITVMKEATVIKPDTWPLKTYGSADLHGQVLANHPKLLAYFFTSELGFYQLNDSSKLIPITKPELIIPYEVPPIRSIEDETPIYEENVLHSMQVDTPIPSLHMSAGTTETSTASTSSTAVLPSSSNSTVTETSQGQNNQNKVVVDFQQLHRNFQGEKKYSAKKEDGKIILENPSLSFDGYQLAQDIDQAAQLLEKIFQHIEDISSHYGDALRDIDAQISDELHYVEFSDADTQHCVKSYKRLQELRVKRRCVKDSMLMANLLVRSMGMELPKKLSTVSEKINHLDQRTYVVRVPEEFQH